MIAPIFERSFAPIDVADLGLADENPLKPLRNGGRLDGHEWRILWRVGMMHDMVIG